MPTKGDVKIFSLLIDFPEYPHVSTSEHVHDRLFGNGNPLEAPLESLAVYYRRSSYGKLELNGGNTLGWYRPSYNRSAVPQNTAGRETLIKEALNHFQSLGHDFSQYDNDGDGVIDYFIVVWTGPDNGWGNFWWGYQPSFVDGAYRIGGKRLSNYSWQWESRPMGQLFTPEVAIHETGHALGLPDYYDYDATVGPKGGVGRLDMMDGNSGDHNCFSKWILEWITPTVISTGSRVVTLSPSATSGDAVLIMPGVTLGKMFSEFFMVQNRQRTANDATIPDNGLLVWHVDAKLDDSGYDFLYNNSYTVHKLLRLLEADGLEEIENGLMANAGDFYLPGDEFGSATRPSSTRYSGANSGVHIYGIVQSGERFSAVLAIEGLGPGTPRNIIIR
jgi:M6 family metalloprotease-like protein